MFREKKYVAKESVVRTHNLAILLKYHVKYCEVWINFVSIFFHPRKCMDMLSLAHYFIQFAPIHL